MVLKYKQYMVPKICTVWSLQKVWWLIKLDIYKFCIFHIGAALSFELKLAVEQIKLFSKFFVFFLAVELYFKPSFYTSLSYMSDSSCILLVHILVHWGCHNKYHLQSGFNNRNLFLMVLEARSSRWGISKFGFPWGLTHRCLLLYVFTWSFFCSSSSLCLFIFI